MPARIAPLAVTAFTATCAAARGTGALAHALETRRSGLTQNTFSTQPLECRIGRVAGIEECTLPGELAAFDSRNHRLAWLGLDADGFRERALAVRERFGATRIALVLGTSTSSIGETERAYRELDADGRLPAAQRRPQVHQPHALGLFVAHALGLAGPNLTIATACSSSAKVFASAERLLRLGLADAAIVGGVDTLCDSVLFGFNSLELVSSEECRPFDAHRRGLSLGEAAGFAILERMPQSGKVEKGTNLLIGYGEASDAHHMSAPHPQGLGAERALDDALARAGLRESQIDYINLHGTASRQNDAVEAALVARRFPATTRASSTKGWTGHTLGAAGILEATITLIALERGMAPGTLNTRELDPVCGPQIRIDNSEADLRIALSNSFGFGGNNCCLAFARGDAA
ncbi:MAG: beta-ketoacyl-ACP synthase [Rudaea sp.]|uniref:beta-ketoacyl-ACP synthase n=1 Tax=Rudaea sp. TaxID=2136325 RepID=UPI0039E43D83